MDGTGHKSRMGWSHGLRPESARIFAGVLFALTIFAAERALAAADPSRDVPPGVQRLVEDAFAANFVYPETNEWTFVSIEPYYGGNLVCGTVNYENAMRKYTGSRHFYAVVGEHAVSKTAIDLDANEDVTGAAAFTMKTLCHLK